MAYDHQDPDILEKVTRIRTALANAMEEEGFEPKALMFAAVIDAGAFYFFLCGSETKEKVDSQEDGKNIRHIFANELSEWSAEFGIDQNWQNN